MGVFAASFNPPTWAHLHLIEEGLKGIPLQEVGVILDKRPMDKEIFGASLVDRLLMLLAIFQERKEISIGVCNQGLFLSKLLALRPHLPPGVRIYLIMGYDTLVRLFDPRYYEDREKALREIFSMAKVLVGLRGEAGERELRSFLSQPAQRPYASSVIPLEIPKGLRSISSTQVRERVKEGLVISGLVPPPVEEFISKRGLYRGDLPPPPQEHLEKPGKDR